MSFDDLNENEIPRDFPPVNSGEPESVPEPRQPEFAEPEPRQPEFAEPEPRQPEFTRPEAEHVADVPQPEARSIPRPEPPYRSDTVPESSAAPARPVQPYGVGDERRSWSEPAYEPAVARVDAYTPGGYAYGAQNVPPQNDGGKKKKKEKKSHGFLKAACLVIVCALVAGAASWLVVDYMLDHSSAQDGHTVVLGGTASSLASDDDPAPVPGTQLTGNQIHQLGIKQVVGVNTSFTTTNIFGMSTPRAVSGSGFIISEDGYILTNYHVISYAVVYGGELTVLTNDGTEYDAEIVGFVEDNDVAVIKINATGLTPVVFGNSDNILVGEAVYAIGNPLGELEYTMTDGIVSAQDRVISTRDEITNATTSINMFQITAAVNAGNSGGPVYNSRGEVIGIVTAKYADEGVEGLGFAIPINDAVNISKQLIEHGSVTGAGLGVSGRDATYFFNELAMESYNIPHGMYVESVDSGSAAEKAGIRVGDIITALDGKTVSSRDELKLALKRYSPGDTVSITVFHLGDHMSAGESRDLTITLQEAPVEDTTTQQQTTPVNPNTGNGGFGFGWPW